jgi:hypothetical protein
MRLSEELMCGSAAPPLHRWVSRLLRHLDIPKSAQINGWGIFPGSDFAIGSSIAALKPELSLKSLAIN